MTTEIKPLYLSRLRETPEMQTTCLYDLILRSRQLQPIDNDLGWVIGDVIAQATQELGEFSEQVMIKEGKLPHKTPESYGVFLEAADVIICVVDAVAKQHPNMSPAQVLSHLGWAINKKGDKWTEKVIKQHQNKFT